MAAKTSVARKIERARGLFSGVIGLAEKGQRDAEDLDGLLLVLQVLKDGHVYQVRVTPRLTPKPLAQAQRITPPPGGRIHLLTVSVNESRPWKEAVCAAGPNTEADSEVWRVGDWRIGDQYPPMVRATEEPCEVILVNFGPRSSTSSRQALAWGRAQRLCPASPRTIFAIGEHSPMLRRNLAVNRLAVVSLKPCSFEGGQRVPGVWGCGSKRGASLYWFTDEWYADDWFAFVREEDIK